MNEIKRKVELFICAVLSAALPTMKFVPSKGEDDAEGESALEPPFTVVDASEAERLIEDEPTWRVPVIVMYVTHIDDTKSSSHSASARAIHDALSGLPRGWYAPQQMIVHGVTINNTDDVTDSKKQSHGDVHMISIICSG